MNPVRKGALAEIKAVAWLLERGYEVFRNISPEGPFDLIAVRSDGVLYIDVKTPSPILFHGVVTVCRQYPHKSALRYPDLKVSILYVYNDIVTWNVADIPIEDPYPEEETNFGELSEFPRCLR